MNQRVGDDKDLPINRALILSPWSGEALKARVVATDPKADLALLKLEHGRLPALPVASAESSQATKLTAKTPGELSTRLRAGKRCRNLGDYIKIFDITLSVLQERKSPREPLKIGAPPEVT